MRFATWDSTLALSLAFFVNAGLLVLSAAAFHGRPEAVTDIREAHRLLDGVLGATFAGTLFAVALLASGQNATITGTMAGQIVLEGFLKIKTAGRGTMKPPQPRMPSCDPARPRGSSCRCA